MKVRMIAAAAVLSVVALAASGVSPGRLVAEAAQLAPAAASRISLQEFKKLLDKGEVIVIDVRDVQAYRQGHIPGAVLVPLDTVSARAPEWKDATRPVVTYCA
jgi:phage shock protein E